MAEQQAERRVFLVKPGDTLVFGNVGEYTAQHLESAGQAVKRILGTDVVFFADDIDMDVLDD